MKPKHASSKIEDRKKQKRMQEILAPLRAALERSASCYSQPEPSATSTPVLAGNGTTSDFQRHEQ
jgi:hypothetical protein